MDTLGNTKHVFASSNTYKGISSLLSDRLDHLNTSTLYIIKGAVGTGKSSFLKRLGNFLADTGQEIIFYHNTIDTSFLDSIYITNSNILITTTNSIDISSSLHSWTVIDFDSLIDKSKLSDDDEFVLNTFNSAFTRNLEKSKFYLESAQAIYKSYLHSTEIGLLKSAKLKYENARIKNVFQLAPEKEGNGSGHATYLYSYALTSNGIVDYIHTLIGKSKTIYLIKENLVCQSKDLMRRLHNLFLHNGYDISCSLSPFDKDKIEDIVVPELSFGITVSNLFRKPKIFPTDIFDFDHCVDYEALVPIAAESDKDFTLFMSLLDKAYFAMDQANQDLINTKKFHSKYLNFDKIDVLFSELAENFIK
ncbi:ATPase [Candidatus Epulonipiscium viviparus]|uniref:ATPase n=1 Tax=Candidatus Epulonipiscium viviparus TaxID=420336 RepID=UPI00016C01BC|nr:ATPase [Candidatus Epulopiscium viviparus]